MSEMRVSRLDEKIESLGIYKTPSIRKKASFEKIAEWYIYGNGRTKKEARAYYGVASRVPCGPVSQQGRECQYPVSLEKDVIVHGPIQIMVCTGKWDSRPVKVASIRLPAPLILYVRC